MSGSPHRRWLCCELGCSQSSWGLWWKRNQCQPRRGWRGRSTWECGGGGQRWQPGWWAGSPAWWPGTCTETGHRAKAAVLHHLRGPGGRILRHWLDSVLDFVVVCTLDTFKKETRFGRKKTSKWHAVLCPYFGFKQFISKSIHPSTFSNWKRKEQHTPVFLPGEFYGWGSLAGYSLWGHKELDTTGWQHFSNISQYEKFCLRIVSSLASMLFIFVYTLLDYKTSWKVKGNKNIRDNTSMISVKYSLLI